MKGNWPKLQPVIAKAAREANDQTLSDLAAALGLSPSHAHRILTESLGETPKEYTLRLRLDRAAGMLATTRDTILDIALVCGFESHEVFARAFRRRPDGLRRSVSPLESRRGIAIAQLPVPQRRWRKFSHGEKRILSASTPMPTSTSITPITWSIAFSSRP